MRISAGEKTGLAIKTRDRTGITNNTGHLSFLQTLVPSCQKGIKNWLHRKVQKPERSNRGITQPLQPPL
jgi:hypothetical protein